VYDDSYGAMAVRLWWMMRWLGHPGVALLGRRLSEMAARKTPVDADIPVPHKGACACLPEPTQIVGADEIMRASETGDQLIIDARPDRRFSGEFENRSTGGRPRPGRHQLPVRRESRRRTAPSCRPRRCARTTRRCSRGKRPGKVLHMCGFRRHRMPQHSGDGNRRPSRLTLYPGSMERVDHRFLPAPLPPANKGERS